VVSEGLMLGLLALNVAALALLALLFKSLRRDLFNIKRLLEALDERLKLNPAVQSSTSKSNVQHEAPLHQRIQSLRLQGLSYGEIASQLGISKSLVHYYLKKKR